MDILPDGSSSGTNVRLVDGVSEVVASWALHMHDTSGKGQHLQCHLGSKTCVSGEYSETGMALLHLFVCSVLGNGMFGSVKGVQMSYCNWGFGGIMRDADVCLVSTLRCCCLALQGRMQPS